MPFFLYSECLNSECLELVKRRDEGIHAGFVSVLLREVDSGELQQLDRAVASAGREEPEVIVDSGLPSVSILFAMETAEIMPVAYL